MHMYITCTVYLVFSNEQYFVSVTNQTDIVWDVGMLLTCIVNSYAED